MKRMHVRPKGGFLPLEGGWPQKHLCNFLKGPDPLPSSRGGAAGKCVLAKFHWLSDVCWRANYRHEAFARSIHSLYFAELEMTDQWCILQDCCFKNYFFGHPGGRRHRTRYA